MSREINDENYLEELFIKEAIPALENAGSQSGGGCGPMTIKAYQYKDLQYYAPTGSASVSYTVEKDCSAVLICSCNQPSTYPFTVNGVSCKVNGVEQNGNIIGQTINWFSDRITFVEDLAAGSVIDLSISGTCSDKAYGHLAVAVITNE